VEVEIPFVPASQRKAAQVVEDSIVVVGQARQRKRKRTKAAVEDVDSLRLANGLDGKKARDEQPNVISKDEVAGDEDEPFDFSTVPNILDNNSDNEASSLKKKRKQKHGMCFNQ
jgi:exosome complex exonuclease RRP6